MNREQYKGGKPEIDQFYRPRYAKVLEKMDLLGIMDITTARQDKNGTIVWKLPIKDADSKLYIEVASFKTGYVRNQGVSCHSNYQLNKRCESEPQFYKMYNGQKFYVTTRTCKLIPNEIDRLEYLISYCLKNYYIKHANLVPNGDYIPKWRHEYELGRVNDTSTDCGHYDRISKLEDSLEESDYRIQDLERMLEGYKTRETDLENKLQSIIRTARH
jgi:hypothetical protein